MIFSSFTFLTHLIRYSVMTYTRWETFPAILKWVVASYWNAFCFLSFPKISAILHTNNPFCPQKCWSLIQRRHNIPSHWALLLFFPLLSFFQRSHKSVNNTAHLLTEISPPLITCPTEASWQCCRQQAWAFHDCWSPTAGTECPAC